MREMENIPKYNIKQSNILVDEDEKNKEQQNILNNQINPQDISLNIKIMENKIEEDNYLSTMFYQNFSVNLLLLSLIFLIIMIEYIYKNSLFSYSLTYEQNLQNYFSDTSMAFFKIISFLGNGVLIGIGLFFIICFFPLVKSIMLCIGVIFMVYLHDVIKLFYGDPRPFWINNILFQGECETSYGNPSGHSLNSFYFFLSFCYYINKMKNIKNNNKMKIIIYLIAIFISGLIAFSRLALGVHSLNQVLYGGAIGIWAFLIFTYVFKIYDMPFRYYLKFYNDRRYISLVIITLIILFIIPIILYSLIDVESDFKKYELFMSKKCSKRKEYKFYSHSCIAESLILLLGAGIYFGQYFFWYMINRQRNEPFETNNNISNYNDYILYLEDIINNWNEYIRGIFTSMGNFIKIIGLIVLCLLPGIFNIIISGKNNSIRNILILKIGLPLFLIGFLTFGPCFYGLIHILKEQKRNY